MNNPFPINTRVNALFTDGVTYPGIVTKAFKTAANVEFDDGDTSKVAHADITLRKRGRKSIADTMTADEIASDVETLLTDLSNADDQGTKMALRRRLRLRGHTGGLRAVASA